MFAQEPGVLSRVVLEAHEKLKEAAPYCLVVAQNMKQQREFAVEYDAIYETESDKKEKTRDEIFDSIKALFQKYVVSFHGYQSEDPEEAFNKEGMLEVLRSLLSGRLVSYEEKKS